MKFNSFSDLCAFPLDVVISNDMKSVPLQRSCIRLGMIEARVERQRGFDGGMILTMELVIF